MAIGRFSVGAILLLAAFSQAQAQDPRYANKHVPFEPGFRVYYIVDMEGMGSVVSIREVIAGNEGERYKNLSSRDYWEHYRSLLTDEVNAAIAGSRLGGAKSFVVNEGHGGNLFANILPWELDPTALLIRGYPKPLLMSTAIDSTFGGIIFTGAHANAGSAGVMSHNFSFERITVNGAVLNEPGINAWIAGEMGVPLIMIAGDDAVVEETKAMLGKNIVGVVDKIAVAGGAAITYSPKKVQSMLRDSARVAVARAMAGRYKPFTLAKPYDIQFTLRRLAPEFVAGIDSLQTRYKFEKVGDRQYKMSTSSAKDLGYLLDAMERVTLR
ncbi:MAG TPA: M55 family metallopeptidase [Longimicrobiales bacterium]|nr:M55 family metallopeptidase [Longimicrobiales bacterium]